MRDFWIRTKDFVRHLDRLVISAAETVFGVGAALFVWALAALALAGAFWPVSAALG